MATQGDFQGAAGTGYYSFPVTNISGSPCLITGYFTASIWTPQGDPIYAPDQFQNITIEPNQSTAPFTLGVEQTATITISIGETPVGSAICPQIGAFHLAPPGQTGGAFLQVSEPPPYDHVACQSFMNIYPSVLG
jgi:hypothetical protein